MDSSDSVRAAGLVGWHRRRTGRGLMCLDSSVVGRRISGWHDRCSFAVCRHEPRKAISRFEFGT